jgi:hypothetical protein
MPEKRVVGGDHQVGVGALVEMPAVTVALGLDDADLLEFLQGSVARRGVGVPLPHRRAVAERLLRWIGDVLVGDTQLGQSRVVVSRHEVRQIRAAAEVVTDTADHHDLDVIVDGRAAQQVGIPEPSRRGRRVEMVGTVERDRRDLGFGVLVVEDDLLGRRPVG